MAESGRIMRDEGISVVLSENGDLGEGPVRKEGPSVEVLEYQDNVQNGRKSGIEPRRKSQENPIDLADPDSVIHMLETCDLTEEDTEDLLQEAYNMNRKLKEMLRRREMESDSSKSKSMKSKSPSKSRSTFDGQSTGSNTSSRQGSGFGIRKVLPPIHQDGKETSVYAIQMRRSKTTFQEPRSHYSYPEPRSKSSKDEVKKDKSPIRRKKTETKPEWNDRFSYS